MIDKLITNSQSTKNIDTIMSEIFKTTLEKCQKNQSDQNRMFRTILKQYDDNIAKIDKSFKDMQAPIAMKEKAIQERINVNDKRTNITEKLEASHRHKVFNNYRCEADRASKYHFQRNSNKKLSVPTHLLRVEIPDEKNKKKMKTISITDQEEISKHFYEHFKQKFQSQRAHLGPINPADLEQEEIPTIDQHAAHEIDHAPYMEETAAAIEAIKTGSSPGPDGISGKLLKFLFHYLKKSMHKLFCYFYENDTYTFNERYLKIIPKPHKGKLHGNKKS